MKYFSGIVFQTVAEAWNLHCFTTETVILNKASSDHDIEI